MQFDDAFDVIGANDASNVLRTLWNWQHFSAGRDLADRLLVGNCIEHYQTAHKAEFTDVFWEPTVFTLAESERVLKAGHRYGLAPKLHADELDS